jgi:hypothetical protein
MSKAITSAARQRTGTVAPARPVNARGGIATRSTRARPSYLQRKAACACGGSCPRCRERAHQSEAAHAADARAEAPAIVHEVLRTPGQPLDRATRAAMEDHFGRDLGPVRIHTDARAAESARAVDALAYTVGRHVVFGSSLYAPRTDAGRHLLAHELAHVVQQDGPSPSTEAIAIGRADDPAEAAAQGAANAALAGQPARLSGGSRSASLQRQRPQSPPVPNLPPRQAATPPAVPLCSGQTDITQTFRTFVTDVPTLLAAAPGISAAEAARVTGIANTVLHTEGAADIDNFTVVSCTGISSSIMLPGETASAFVDVTNRTLGLGTALVTAMAAFRAAPSVAGLLPILTIVAHEKRHATIAGAAAVPVGGLQTGFDQSYTDKASYRVEEILTVSEEIAVSHLVDQQSFHVPVAMQTQFRQLWNTALAWVTPAEAARLRGVIIDQLRGRYGFTNGCDNAITVGVLNSMDTGRWYFCDTGTRRVPHAIPAGLNVCEVDGRHTIC